MKKAIKIGKWAGIVVLSPIMFFLLLAILLYIPPVQNFVVHQVAHKMSESMGMDFRIEKVRLAFPLDLAVHHVVAIEKGDTLLNANHLRLNVQLLPLLKGRADVDGLELYGLKLDTKSYIADTHIKGQADALVAAAHGVDWEKELVKLDHAKLKGADFVVELSDTAQKDTTQSKTKWNIAVNKAHIENTRVRIIMPGDSMRIYAEMEQALLQGGCFDTGRNYYAVQSLQLKNAAAKYDIPYIKPRVGIDPNHLAITQLSLQLDTLTYNNEGVLRAGIRYLQLHEKCGLQLSRLCGNVYVDSTRIQLPDFKLRTPSSHIDAQVALDFRAFNEHKGAIAKHG